MRAKVVAPRSSGQVEARSDNEILFTFPTPRDVELHLDQQLEFDPFIVNRPQVARNVSTGQDLTIELQENSAHDLRLRVRHDGSRTPTPERIRSA